MEQSEWSGLLEAQTRMDKETQTCIPAHVPVTGVYLEESSPLDSGNVSSAQEASVDLAELRDSLQRTQEVLKNLALTATLAAGTPAEPPIPRVKSWWGKHCFPTRRRLLYRHITLITVILQFLNLVILTLLDIWPRRDEEEDNIIMASSVTMIVLQLANLIILILATGRLVKQVVRHEVNSFFLAQSYMATLLLFAGIYTVTYRLQTKSWKFIYEDLDDPVQVFLLYLKFLFFSISTGTLCGADNAFPQMWYNQTVAALQMVLSFCYFASILGISAGTTPPPKQENKDRQEEEERQTEQQEQPAENGYRRLSNDAYLSSSVSQPNVEWGSLRTHTGDVPCILWSAEHSSPASITSEDIQNGLACADPSLNSI